MNKYITFGFLALVFFLAKPPSTAAALSTFPTQPVVEERVREYFKKNPVMIEIARCESNFRQFTDSGSVLRGGSGGEMVGVFQFFESIHTAAAAKLGHDITTLEGNLAYAEYVFQTEGSTPWNSAKSCWDVAESEISENVIVGLGTRQQDLELQIQLLLKIIELLKELQRLQV